MQRLFLQCMAVVFLFTSVAFGQDSDAVMPIEGKRYLSIDAQGNRSSGLTRQGDCIWNNSADSGWFNAWDDKYVNIDWGRLYDLGNHLPDEVVDGFLFGYATDATGTVGFSMYFFDSCTGFTDPTIVWEGSFHLTGLPGGIGPPGDYWHWQIEVDLEGSGLEFLLGEEIGLGHEVTYAIGDTYTGGVMTYPPGCHGNGQTGTQDVFDIAFPVYSWTNGPNYYRHPG